MSDTHTIYLKDYRPPAFQIEQVDLHFEIHKGHTRVKSKLTIQRNGKHKEALKLNGEHLELKSITLDGKPLTAYTVDDKFLTIENAPDSFTLETVGETYPEKNTALEGLYRSGSAYCTQCEPEGFRRITWFIDRPDVMAKFRVRMEADKESCPVLLSNGNLTDSGDLGGGRHFAVWEDPFLKPCYLFALVAGNLGYVHDKFKTMSDRDVDLYIYVEPGNEDKCAHAMESLKKSMKWDEDVYGREYDLNIYNIVAVSDFNMGAMENKSLNVFNTAYILASADTATDDDFLGIEGVIGHEYFHNWTGNRITCRDWFQLSLKEGLTVFRDQSFSADMNSHAAKRIEDVGGLRNGQFPEDAGPMAHPVRPDNYIEINNFYTATVYEKGAEVIRMMHDILGPKTYRKATDLYFERHDGQAVTCEDFAKCMEDASGIDLTQFKLWYSQSGTPEVRVSGTYDEKAKKYTLKLSQHLSPSPGQPDKKPMHIPVAVGLLGPNGEDLLPENTRVLQLQKPEQDFVFENISSPPVPSLLRGFSAPVTLKTDLTEKDLRFLMVHDSDGFNKWEAGQTYATRVILDLIANPGKTIDKAFLQAFDDLISDDERADPALLAEALILPSETYLAQQMAVIDPLAIHTTRRRVITEIVQNSADKLMKLYTSNSDKGPYKIDPQSMGRRSVKNVALRYLISDQDPKVIALAYDQYKTASNMTDRVAALSLLTETTSAQRDQALQDFYSRWQNDALVIDKWFGIQARAARPDCLEQVEKLTHHSDFTLKNPNRVRSLIGAFAGGNPSQFHRTDGKGYQFLAGHIIALNAINPQIAARLMSPLRQWKRYDAHRKDLMRAQIRRIVETPGLSPDVFEVASKTLNL